MFRPLADTEPQSFRLPDGARTDVMGAPTKKNLETSTEEAPCNYDGKPMDADSTAHRK
jgi:hypothetical protein